MNILFETACLKFPAVRIFFAYYPGYVAVAIVKMFVSDQLYFDLVLLYLFDRIGHERNSDYSARPNDDYILAKDSVNYNHLAEVDYGNLWHERNAHHYMAHESNLA